ncbi:unnamed protein product [Echinostoma caproni]|uniref:BHLH domain-containing protein n=1 Tax=Echinostoma caproni TaxID=27848 RepID=A0A183B0F7_9TREM|nr:unnamed protein product [Echinostoma caproni]
MRTNKECPMYGKSGTGAVPSADLPTSRRGLDRSRARGAPGSRGQLDGLAKCDADAIAAAQALASRPVCELLAEQEEQEAAEHKHGAAGGGGGGGGGSTDAEGTSQDRLHADESRDSTSAFGETDMTVEGTKLKLHSNLTRYIQEQNRRNLKLKIHRQLLDRLNAASEMVQSATAHRRSLASRQAAAASSGGSGRGRRTNLIDDEFPTGIKNRGNRRRIDPRVALNHIFEGIYKVCSMVTLSRLISIVRVCIS